MNHHRSFLPSLEALEARVNPTVTLPPSGNLSSVTIVGDADDDALTILHEQGKLIVTAGTQTEVYTASDFTVTLRLRGGNDTVAYTIGGDLAGGSLALTARLGAGRDTVTITQAAGVDIDGASVRLTILGGTQGDTVNVNLGDQVNVINSGALRVEAKLGLGRDTYAANFGLGSDLELQVGSGSQLNFTAQGGRGGDTMSATGDFQGTGEGVLGTAVFDFRGGRERDTVNVAFGGEFAADMAGGGFSVLARGGDRPDTVTVDMNISVTALSTQELVDEDLVDLGGLLGVVTEGQTLTDLIDGAMIDADGLLDTLGLAPDDLSALNVGDLVDVGVLDLGPLQSLIDLGVLDLDVLRGMELGAMLEFEVTILGVPTPLGDLLNVDMQALGLDIVAGVSLSEIDARGFIDLDLSTLDPSAVLGDLNLLDLRDLGLVDLDELEGLLGGLLDASLLDLDNLGLLDLGLIDLGGVLPEDLKLLDLGLLDLDQLGLLDLDDANDVELAGISGMDGGWDVLVTGGRGKDSLTIDLTDVPDPDNFDLGLMDGGTGTDLGVVLGDPSLTSKVHVIHVEGP